MKINDFYKILILSITLNTSIFSAQDTSRLFLDLKDVDIKDVIQMISKAHNVNIILGNNVIGRVTVRLVDKTIKDGLRAIAVSGGWDVVIEENGIYRIIDPTNEPDRAIKWINNKLSFDIRNMELTDFIRGVSNVSGINILVDNGISIRLTGKISNVDFEEGLRGILEANGCRLLKQKNIYRISKAQQQTTNTVEARIECTNGRVTLEVSNGNLMEVIREIARQANMEIVTYGDFYEKVNATLHSIPLSEAIAVLLGGTPLTFVQNNNLIMIGLRDASTPSGLALSTSELIPLRHIKADEILRILPRNIPESNVKVVKEHNALLATGTSEDIVKMKSFLNKIDIPVPQVIIDAIVVEYSKDAISDFGMSINTTSPKESRSFAFPDFQINASEAPNTIFKKLGATTIKGFLDQNFFFNLKMLENKNQAKVLGRPSITVLNGNQAVIDVGQTQYRKVGAGTAENPTYRFEPISFGIKLQITPWISSSGQITTVVSPEISNAMGTNEDNYPNIFKRAVSTTVRLENGETLILGGLLRAEDQIKHSQVPFLGDIPFLGHLFKTTHKENVETNLVIYVTPRIIENTPNVNVPNSLDDIKLTSQKEKSDSVKTAIENR